MLTANSVTTWRISMVITHSNLWTRRLAISKTVTCIRYFRIDLEIGAPGAVMRGNTLQGEALEV